MAAKIVRGKPIADEIRADILPKLRARRAAGRPARVVAITIAGAPASEIYAGMQGRACEKAGVEFSAEQIDAGTSQTDLEALISKHNADPSVTGISLHLPLPDHLDQLAAQIRIDPRKDVEGIHPHNIGMMAFREHHPVPSAARAAVEMVRRTLSSIRGLEAVIVGHSAMVGKPIASMLLESKYDAPTVTTCHIATRDLASHTRRAELLFVAVGEAEMIRGHMIRPGAFVVDIGINQRHGKVVGDVHFDEASEVAGFLTPVPGGVGPVSVALFLRNVLACARAME